MNATFLRNTLTRQLARLAADLADMAPAFNPFPSGSADAAEWQAHYDARRRELAYYCAPDEFERDRAPALGWDANGSPA